MDCLKERDELKLEKDEIKQVNEKLQQENDELQLRLYNSQQLMTKNDQQFAEQLAEKEEIIDKLKQQLARAKRLPYQFLRIIK